MKQEIRKTGQKVNCNDKEEYKIIAEKKLARDVKEQGTDDQQLPKVTTTKQNVTNITAAPKDKLTEDAKYQRKDWAQENEDN